MNHSLNKLLGFKGEDFAVNYLCKLGFVILDRNFRYKHSEIDIIAKKNSCIHFVEVKYRKTNCFGYPENFVSDKQKERIKIAAENYIYLKKWNGDIKFDIISIEKKSTTCIPVMFEDSF